MRTSESVRYYVGIWCHRTQCPNDTKHNRAPYSCNFNREVVVFLKPFNFFDFVIMVTGNKHANEETFVLLRCQRQLCIVWLPQGRSSFNFVVLNHHLCYVTIPVFVDEVHTSNIGTNADGIPWWCLYSFYLTPTHKLY